MHSGLGNYGRAADGRRNKPKWSMRFERVLAMESDILKRALAGDVADLMAAYSEMLDLRLEMARMTTQCLTNMRAVLDSEQWEKMVLRYRALLES